MKQVRIGWLGLRLFLVWWLLPTLALAALGLPAAGFCLGFSLFPVVALGIAIYGVWVQNRWYRDASFARSPEAFHRATIQTAMPMDEAERMLAAILQEDLGASRFSMGAHRLHALFLPPGWSGWWRRWALSDEITVEVHPAGAEGGSMGMGCMLEASARPCSRFFYGVLWFDRGRNYLRLQKVRELFSERMIQALQKKEAGWKSDSLEGRLAQAELLLLRAQVEPHFLFNTLAHLRALIRSEDTPKALEMIDHLIAHARAASDRIRRPTHHLDQELEAVRGYLSLIQLRFGERLGFEIFCASGLENCEVPVGCLLVPVENTIKHGLEPRQAAGRVEVSCRAEGEVLLLEVLDDGLGLHLEAGTGGSGLANLRERLRLLHAESASLAVENREEGGVQVRIQTPLQRKA